MARFGVSMCLKIKFTKATGDARFLLNFRENALSGKSDKKQLISARFELQL